MDSPEAASAVLDVNIVVRVEKLGDTGYSFKIEAVEGPNYVEGFDLFYEAGSEDAHADDRSLIDVLRDHYGEGQGDLRKLGMLMAMARGFVVDKINDGR